MKLLTIFRFEFAYQISRAWTWLFFGVLLLLSFLMTRDGSLSEVLYTDFFINSPFAIAKTTVFGSLVWLVMAAAVAGEAASRDVATGMYPLTYTAPVSKASYLGGQLIAALVLNALILLAVQAGIMLGVYLPGVDAEAIGPFRPAAYLTAYAYIALPNAFAATAIQFWLASRSGRPMASYVGSVLIVFMGFFVASLLLFKRGLGTLLDPIGIRFIVEDVAHLWTTVEKSWRLLELNGVLLTNRLLWLGIGLAALAIAYLNFRFTHRTESISFWKRLKRPLQRFKKDKDVGSPVPASIGLALRTAISVPQVQRTFGFVTHAQQVLAISWTSFRTIATSWTGLAILTFIPLITIPVVLDQMGYDGGVLVPTAIRVIRELTAPLSAELSRWVIVPAFIVFFAGELVWREREARLGEITDAMPGSDWSPFLGKFLGLGLFLVLFLTMLMIAGMFAQVIMNYQPDSYANEIGLFLKIMFGLQLPEYLLFALLALTIHVLINQKYTGHLVAIIAYIFIALSSLFGIEHNLLVYGAGPEWSYTDMRGFGPSLGPWLWFKLYWAAWALLLAVIARLLWVRGKENGFRVRLKLARLRLTRTTVVTSGIAIVLMLALGSFIFYNTNVLNRYINASGLKERQATYERSYGRYKNMAQPIITGTSLHLDIYPGQRAADIRGTYRLVNRSPDAIDSILVAAVSAIKTIDIKFDKQAVAVFADKEFGHQMYKLEKPLQPGDSLQLNFQLRVEPNGFRESGTDASIVENGTFFTNGLLPDLGYQASRELITASDRRAYGLSPRPLIASLYDAEAPKHRGEGISFEAVVSTDHDQIAGAPGALRRTWMEGGRRYFHYATDGPIGSEGTFFSANYAMHETQWKNPDSAGQSVTIRIFHQPEHKAHLERMLKGITTSLEYYTRQFGPYRYNHISVVEAPGDGTGLHADASMLTHSEGFALWNPRDEPGSVDFPFAIIAHEMAHQWTVPYANVEGAPVMSESIAWYYGMKVVEHAKGREDLHGLLSVMRQPHPFAPIRRGEPLLRGLDQYLSYRRGPFALYTMSEYIGEEQVNLALRRLLEKHRPKTAPLATTLDLYRELQAVTPDSLKYLLHDLFEVNTYWKFETEQVSAKQTATGAWQVTLEVQARKLMMNEAGAETAVQMNDLVEIGVFAPAEAGEGPGKLIYLEKHRIRSGKQPITVTVPRKPAHAAVDPNQLLIYLEENEHIEKVTIK